MICCLVHLRFFCFIVVGCSCSPRFLVTHLHFSNDQSNWSPPSCSTTFQNALSSSDLLSELSKLLHHKKLCSKFSTLLVSSLNFTSSFWSRSLLVECCFCLGDAGFNFIRKSCIFCHQSTPSNIQIFRWLLMGKLSFCFKKSNIDAYREFGLI